MTRLIGYCRVSTDEQAASGYSLHEQEATLRTALSRTGDELVVVIVDPGFSGKDLRRPGITKALRMIADGEADGLVCTKLDRLTRSVRDLIDLADWFKDNDLTLRMLDTGLDSSTAVGRMMLVNMGAAAQMVLDMLGENTRAAFRTPGSVPKAKLHASRPRVPDDVTELIAKLDADGFGLSEIARELTARGVPTARGGKWYPSTIRSVLYERKATNRNPTTLPEIKRQPRRKRRVA